MSLVKSASSLAVIAHGVVDLVSSEDFCFQRILQFQIEHRNISHSISSSSYPEYRDNQGYRRRRIQMAFLFCLLVLGCSYFSWPIVGAHDNGLGMTPPLGWRSWNLYEGNVNQSQITRIMDGMVRRKHNRKDHLGNIISLADLGYRDVGLDDTWQKCNSPDAAEGMHYHDQYGNPIVNLDRFPSLWEMTRHARALNLTAGWYANNCACRYVSRAVVLYVESFNIHRFLLNSNTS